MTSARARAKSVMGSADACTRCKSATARASVSNMPKPHCSSGVISPKAGRRVRIDDEARELFASQGEAFTTRLCRLQARQLEAAYGEFRTEMEAISQAFPSLAHEAGALAGYGRELFGAEGPDAGSFLETLERKLAAARDMIEACQRARAVVDNAASAVVKTMDDLRRRTDGLQEISVDVTIIGTNAMLRSTRLGDLGKGISFIAQELRANGEQIGNGIQSLPPALDRVVAYVERLAQSGQHLEFGAIGRTRRMHERGDLRFRRQRPADVGSACTARHRRRRRSCSARSSRRRARRTRGHRPDPYRRRRGRWRKSQRGWAKPKIGTRSILPSTGACARSTRWRANGASTRV